MTDAYIALGFAIFIWWFSTGLILYLNGLPRWTFKWTLTGASFFLALALIGASTAGFAFENFKGVGRGATPAELKAWDIDAE